MSGKREPVLMLTVLAAVVAAFVFGPAAYRSITADGPLVEKQAVVGGPFTLVDPLGRPVKNTDFEGKPLVLVFGFTHCPEICPATLLNMAGWMEALGADADKMHFAFVSVDPERDTPERMGEYMEAFDPRITGLTGSPEQVETSARAYRVYVRKVETGDGDYTVDHSTLTYVMDAKGRFVTMIGYSEERDKAVAKLKQAIGGT